MFAISFSQRPTLPSFKQEVEKKLQKQNLRNKITWFKITKHIRQINSWKKNVFQYSRTRLISRSIYKQTKKKKQNFTQANIQFFQEKNCFFSPKPKESWKNHKKMCCDKSQQKKRKQ